MATATAEPDGNTTDNAKPTSKMGLILSVVLCLLGGGLGFYGVYSGLIPIGGTSQAAMPSKSKAADLPDDAFVTIPTLSDTRPTGAENKNLRFSAKVEVPSEYQSEVESLRPGMEESMKGDMRERKEQDIEGPGALFRIRVHLLDRKSVV